MNAQKMTDNFQKEETQFIKNLLIMVIIGLFIIVITNANYKKIQEEADHRIDAAVDTAYEAGYSIGFEEGYANRDQLQIIEEWFSGIKITDAIEEDGIGTVKIIDKSDNLWVITYNVN